MTPHPAESALPDDLPQEWRIGLAGNANIVTYNGEDIVGVATVMPPETAEKIVSYYNTLRAALIAQRERAEQANMTLDATRYHLQQASERAESLQKDAERWRGFRVRARFSNYSNRKELVMPIGVHISVSNGEEHAAAVNAAIDAALSGEKANG